MAKVRVVIIDPDTDKVLDEETFDDRHHRTAVALSSLIMILLRNHFYPDEE